MATQGKRRALGQHFLKNASVAQSIATEAVQQCVSHQCTGLLEIGPGRGAITHPLLNLLKDAKGVERFLIVERDWDLGRYWEEYSVSPEYKSSFSAQAPQMPKISVKTGDFLEIPQTEWLSQTPLAVVSNLPYSSGTAIVTRLARHPDKIKVMVLMFQAEVARRLRAEPSTKDRGSLSIWIQNRWDVQKFLAVKPAAFNPPPQVDSEVVVLTRRETPRVPFPETEAVEKLWESFLRACFAHRRKMLRSSFPWQNALELSGVDGTKRPEALDWNEWNQLFQAVRDSA